MYDAKSVHPQTRVRIIDLARTSACEGDVARLQHCVPWVDGNGEDGYLTGLRNMISIFEGLLEG